jgi:hypothetical protein
MSIEIRTAHQAVQVSETKGLLEGWAFYLTTESHNQITDEVSQVRIVLDRTELKELATDILAMLEA